MKILEKWREFQANNKKKLEESKATRDVMNQYRGMRVSRICFPKMGAPYMETKRANGVETRDYLDGKLLVLVPDGKQDLVEILYYEPDDEKG